METPLKPPVWQAEAPAPLTCQCGAGAFACQQQRLHYFWWAAYGRGFLLGNASLLSGREWTMGTIARLPCDEAAILAGSCQRPVATNGPWILAATILGSSMVFIDGTVVNVALPALQSALRADPGGRSMGGGILRSVPGYAAPHWRVFRGPVRPPQDLRGRSSTLLRSLGLVRTRAQHPAAYCCAGVSRE